MSSSSGVEQLESTVLDYEKIAEEEKKVREIIQSEEEKESQSGRIIRGEVVGFKNQGENIIFVIVGLNGGVYSITLPLTVDAPTSESKGIQFMESVGGSRSPKDCLYKSVPIVNSYSNGISVAYGDGSELYFYKKKYPILKKAFKTTRSGDLEPERGFIFLASLSLFLIFIIISLSIIAVSILSPAGIPLIFIGVTLLLSSFFIILRRGILRLAKKSDSYELEIATEISSDHPLYEEFIADFEKTQTGQELESE